MTSLVQKLEAIHVGLDRAHIDHAFGGAAALAFCVDDPRATADIDINVFVPPTDVGSVFSALPAEIPTDGQALARVQASGQVRLRWGETPVDLFFANHPFHDHAASRTLRVPFGAYEIDVLECSDLAVFKAVFGRPKDWIDIEAMASAGTLDGIAVLRGYRRPRVSAAGGGSLAAGTRGRARPRVQEPRPAAA